MGIMKVYGALMQIPGMETAEYTWQEQVAINWEGMGFMRWPLAACLVLGILVILWKLVDLQMKAGRNRSLLKEADGLIAEGRLEEALAVCEDSRAPAAQVLKAGLRRRDEGTERVMAAIDEQPAAAGPVGDDGRTVCGIMEIAAETGSATEMLEEVAELRKDRTVLLDQLKAVIAALETKTDKNDTETLAMIRDYSLYVSAVSGDEVDIKDATSTWLVIR